MGVKCIMDTKLIQQTIRLLINSCDKVVITAGSEFNWKKRKNNKVIASIEEQSAIQEMSVLLSVAWDEESQGWLDNWPRLYINLLEDSKLTYSIGVVNRATIMVSDLDDVLNIVEYEKFGEFLEALGANPNKIYA